MDTYPIDMDSIATLCGQLRILSVETRLRMLLLLRQRNLCVGALARRLSLSQGAVSQHLKVLRDAGLVAAERDGYYVHYRVDKQILAQWQREFDGMLDRLQEKQPSAVVASEATATHCEKHKEDACARRMNKAVVGKGTT